METLYWFAAGALGSFLVWNEERMDMGLPWCPTPRAIFVGALASWLGPFVLIFSIAYVLIGLVMQFGRSGNRFSEWWKTPICSSRKKSQR